MLMPERGEYAMTLSWFCGRDRPWQDIADAVFDFVLGNNRKSRQNSLMATLTEQIADMLWSIVMQQILLIQVGLMQAVPMVGTPLSFVYTCWLYSLYSFEYTWLNARWSVRKRLDYYESHWAYFLGFGVPFTVATFFLSFFVGAAIFSLLFPVFIAVAAAASPIPSSRKNSFLGLVPDRLPICYVARNLTNSLMANIEEKARTAVSS
eukprot:m.429022 g.429022  ORF g.429022 m.429022 type:complete len:207 (+) comp20235_c0_seq11:340-960(+)